MKLKNFTDLNAWAVEQWGDAELGDSLGHKRSNASGVGTTTLIGASLLEQVLTVNEESPAFPIK